MKEKFISIIIPAMNEEMVLEATVKNLMSKLIIPYEIIIVNDNSIDNTQKIAEKLSNENNNIRVIKREENPGFGNTIREGFKNAKGVACIPVMADLCDDPGTINIMYKYIDDYDVIIGCRHCKNGEMVKSPKLKRQIAINYSRLTKFILGIPTKDITNAFKLYKREMLYSINIERDDFSLSVEIPIKFYFKGAKFKDVPTVWRGREKGKSKFKIIKMGKVYISLFLYGLKRKFFG